MTESEKKSLKQGGRVTKYEKKEDHEKLLAKVDNLEAVVQR